MFRLGSIFLLLLFVAGCTSYPWEDTGFTTDRPNKELLEIRQKFQNDQELRKSLPQNWQISGILDVEHPTQGRRNRVIITARKPDQLRLRIYGPFKQVAFDLLVDDEWLQLTKPRNRQVVRVPATLAGMIYLTGFHLDPTDLGQFFKGTTTHIATQIKDTYQGVEATTKSGERLILDSQNGYIKIRKPSISSKNQYSVQYFWSKEQLSAPYSTLPKKLVITIPDEDTVLTFDLRRWKFNKTEPQSKMIAVPAGFSVIEPLQ
ncbi:MAG: hypothetical protein HQL69_10215 [Magnetococcales bacterium]|nr:hypothetical protein [Magnetococcales bacterium]